ncbi:MAG TPA: 3D domain-containing protein [Pyrinomonadaceae bacterium]|nr:3D domain-containing protein [Pyrinomonadaceae bacterium]
MKLLVRGGASLMAALFASFLIFYARPLLAETGNPSQEPAQNKQQTKRPEQAAQQNKEKEAHAEAKTETAEASGEVVAAPSNRAAKSEEITVAAASQIYNATSYSRPGRGASGMGVRLGTIAADPKLLPYGTRVRIDAGPYSGEYVVTDAGTAIRGRKIDIWLPSYAQACRFGRRDVKLTVLSYGGKRASKAKGK